MKKKPTKIPSVITQWKNKKGLIISLEKRLSALKNEEPEINLEKFKEFVEELNKLEEKYKNLEQN